MNSLRLAVLASLVAASAATARADDILVPQDVKNLKDALLAAQPGDRVIVTGGNWRNGRVISAITLTARLGATLSGLWEIQGAGATVEGFAVRDGQIEVEADGVTLRRNRFSAPRYTVMVSGTGVTALTIEDNRFDSAVAQLDESTDAVLRRNRVAVGELIVSGNGTTVEDNVLVRRAQIGVHNGSGALVAHNRASSISMYEMNDAIVRDNTVRGGEFGVRGDRVLVSGNEIRAGRGLFVNGDDAIVAENRVFVARGWMSVSGDRAVVTDNLIDNLATTRRTTTTTALFYVHGAGAASILRNEVRHRAFAGAVVECDGGEIAHNLITGEAAFTSLTINGSLNNVHDNTLRLTGVSDPHASALVVVGDENVVADTSVEGAGYDGISIDGAGNLIARVHVERSGRCGITVGETATGTGVADCVVNGSRWASLFVLGTDTTVTGGSFTNGRKVDVLDLGAGTEFVSATFETKSESEALRPFR
jgi:hypothetical protein